MLHDFHHLLRITARSVDTAIVKRVRSTGLLPGQPKVLEYLLECGPSSPKAIAEGCVFDKSTITSLLNGLERSGLVSREAREEDRRSVVISLTPCGENKAEKVASLCSEVDKKVLSGFSAEEKLELIELLARVRKNLGEER